MPISHLKKPKSKLLNKLPKLKFPNPVPKLALSREQPYCRPPMLPLKILPLEYPKISLVLILIPLPPIRLPNPNEFVKELTWLLTADVPPVVTFLTILSPIGFALNAMAQIVLRQIILEIVCRILGLRLQFCKTFRSRFYR